MVSYRWVCRTDGGRWLCCAVLPHSFLVPISQPRSPSRLPWPPPPRHVYPRHHIFCHLETSRASINAIFSRAKQVQPLSSTFRDTRFDMASQPVQGGFGVFERTLEKFKNDLKPGDADIFRCTTLKDVLADIEQLQKRQNSQRRLQAIAQLKPTLEALNQLGKVVKVFANSSEYVAFVWVCVPP